MDEQKTADVSTDEPTVLQPGQTISPSNTATEAPIAPVDAAVQPFVSPVKTVQSTTSAAADNPSPTPSPTPAPEPTPEEPKVPDFTNPATTGASVDLTNSDSQDADDSITWTASEFIAHTKSLGWYAMLGVVTVLIATVIFLITRDKITTAVVVVAAFALGVYGARKPRELPYGLYPAGLSIGEKEYLYDNFRSFAVVDEGGVSSIVFMPMKRFGQLLTIYFDPRQEQEIVDLLSSRLPLEERKLDALDRFMKSIRF